MSFGVDDSPVAIIERIKGAEVLRNPLNFEKAYGPIIVSGHQGTAVGTENA
jgi:hypothetical protein